MHPVLTTLHVGEAVVPIASYGVLLACALLVGSLGTLRAARAAALELGAVISALGLAVALGFAGALAVHGAAQLARTGTFAAVLAQPGVSVLGALLGGLVAIVASARWLGLPAARLLDGSVPWVALAQAIGRIGCLLGGCCYGAVSSAPWAVGYPAHGGDLVMRQPVPLLEAGALIGLAALYFSPPARLAAWLRAPGARAASYLALYASVRLALEPLRGDAVRGVYFGGAVSTGQLLAALVLIGAALFLRRNSVHTASCAEPL
jgi:phosphatidylglycerol:prolipoprotein diacylglycerol transferase